MYKSLGVKCGKKVTFFSGVRISGYKNIILGNKISIARGSRLEAHSQGLIKIGNNVSLNENSVIGASEKGEIIIGNNVLIAQNVVLRASDHGFQSANTPMIEQGHNNGKITIEDNVWVGANSVITRNVTIGSGSIVGAGAVVTKNVNNNVIVGGVPAKFISKRV